MQFEVDIIKAFQNGRTDFWDAFFNVYSYAASLWAVLALIGLFFFFYNRRFAIAFGLTAGAAGLACLILKRIIQRPRPFVANVAEIFDIGRESGFAFPSGHMTTMAVIVCFLLYIIYKHLKPKWRIIWTVVLGCATVLMAIDRMYLGAHYLTDTLAGFALGSFVCFVALLTLPKIDKALTNWWDKRKKAKEQQQQAKKEGGGVITPNE